MADCKHTNTYTIVIYLFNNNQKVKYPCGKGHCSSVKTPRKLVCVWHTCCNCRYHLIKLSSVEVVTKRYFQSYHLIEEILEILKLVNVFNSWIEYFHYFSTTSLTPSLSHQVIDHCGNMALYVCVHWLILK